MLTTFSGRPPSQNEFELTQFIHLLNQRKVKRYLEIGARHGDTFYEVMRSLPKDAFGLAVDLPGGLWGTKKSPSSLHKAIVALDDLGYSGAVLLGDSQTRDVVEKIKSFGRFDAILIDGDHTLPGVTADWNNYQDLAPLIAFHDIVGTGMHEKVSNQPVEVPILWQQIKSHHTTREFIDKDSKMGIGVVFMD